MLLLEEIRPSIDKLLNILVLLATYTFSMLREVYCDRLEMGQDQTFLSQRTLLAVLVTECEVEICELTKNIPFEIEDEIVRQRFPFGFFFDNLWFLVLGWRLHDFGL